MPEARIVDELPFGFGWIRDEAMARCSHALAVDGHVWIVDPIEADGVDERIRALGEVAGVVQLLDRHNRDCAAFARRFGVPRYEVPRERLDGAPFEFLVVRKGWTWQEVALWWPAEGVLACGDALGTGPFYLAEDERLAVHPLLRIWPPRKRLGRRVSGVRHVLCGHGEGVHGEGADVAVHEALATAPSRGPAWLRTVWRRRRELRA